MPPAGEASRQQPVIVVVDDAATLSRVGRELTNRYAADYTVIVEPSPDGCRRRLEELREQRREVALVLAARTVGGEDLLTFARALHPHSRRALLLGWGELRSAREDIVRVVNQGPAEYGVCRPVSSPDERFHRIITEFLDEWWRLQGIPFEAIRIVGDPHAPRSHEMCDLLQRHDLPYGFYAQHSTEGRALLGEAGLSDARLPVVVLHTGQTIVDPTAVELATALGARTRACGGVYDVAIVGGGPAGLAASVYAGSEGLRTALIERQAMGGQAGTSSMIRNYLGFPRGISGTELASRALDQAILFGTDMVYGGDAISLRVEDELRVLELADGSEVAARAVVVATGVAYRQLGNPQLEPFHGTGVFYGAAVSEARAVTGEHVFVVGGGNSAGQAAMYLAKFAEQVTIAVRSSSLRHSMSEYLVSDIDAAANIDVRYEVEIAGGGGNGRLAWLDVMDRGSGQVDRVAAAGLFVLIGARPCTDWLPDSVARDDGGYLVTGPSCSCAVCGSDRRADRLLFETTTPGVFAVGDVRHESVKRVASAAGEGAVCVRLIHEYLAGHSLDAPPPAPPVTVPGQIVRTG